MAGKPSFSASEVNQYMVPDFVAAALRPNCFKTSENDRLVFGALCHEAINDSDTMFQLRLELLAGNPELLNDFWGVVSLIDNLSPRAIQLFKLVIERSGGRQSKITYWGEEKKLEEYARKSYRHMIENLFLEICEATNHLQAEDRFRDEYRAAFPYVPLLEEFGGPPENTSGVHSFAGRFWRAAGKY